MLQKIRESLLYKSIALMALLSGGPLMAVNLLLGTHVLMLGGLLCSLLGWSYMKYYDQEKKTSLLRETHDKRKKFQRDNGWKLLKRSTYKDGDMLPPLLLYLFILDTAFDLSLSAALIQWKLILLFPILLLLLLSYLGREIRENRRAKQEYNSQYLDIDHDCHD